mgnify:CR=1 FL=1
MKNINTLSGLSVANFSKQIDGKETALYTLCDHELWSENRLADGSG